MFPFKQYRDSDVNLTCVYAAVQRWHNNTYYTFLNFPRPNFGFCLIESGEIEYSFLNGSRLIAASGDVVYLPKGSCYKATFHAPKPTPEKSKNPPVSAANTNENTNASATANERANDEMHDIVVNFQCADFDLHDESIFPRDKSAYIVATNAGVELKRLFKGLSAAYHSYGGTFRVKSLIYRIFDALSGVGSGESFRERVERLISGEDFLFMSETQAAACVSAGVSTLQRFFKSEYGKTFSELRTAMKIERSKRFLSETDYSVRRIADELGFYDQSYFCKIFKKHEGVSPKEYARKTRPI